MIQGEVRKVADTKILVFPVKNSNDHQVTVYSNTVQINKKPVAMILPFPNHSGKNYVKVLESTTYDNKMFDYLDNFFPDPISLTFDSTNDSFSPRGYSSNKLEVKRSGSYRYSLVNTLGDFDKLDNSVFELYDFDLKNILSKYYINYGFIVCIIDASAEYSPFMYISEKLPDNMLYVPTRHYHGNGFHKQEVWDHKIFVLGSKDKFAIGNLQNIDVVKMRGSGFSTKAFSFDKLMPNYLSRDNCAALRMEGMITNADLKFESI